MNVPRQSLAIATLMVAVLFLTMTARIGWTEPVSAPTLMVVLDGSGSMWGKLGAESKTKIALSQTYLKLALAKPKTNLKLGLVSFGHRRAGTCSDAQVLVPPAVNSAQAVTARIAALSPRGKGPLSLALRKTVASLEANASGTIVVIHDGVDNCRQDPCKVAEEIAKSHPKMSLQLISLNLDATDAKSMRCLATKTGGKATVVKTAKALKSAIDAALTRAMLQPKVAAKQTSDLTSSPPKTARSAPDKGPSRIRLVAGFKTDSGRRIRDISWTISTTTEPAKVVIRKKTTELTAEIQPGTYVVQARAGLANTQQTIKVPEKGEKRARLMLDAGTLVFGSGRPEQITKDASDPIFLTLRAKQDKAAADDDGRPLWIGSQNNTSPMIVPTGEFELDIERGHTKKTLPITINAGKTTSIDTVLDAGLLILDSMIATLPGTDSVILSQDYSVGYIISTDDPSAPGGRREVGRSASPHAKFQLQPGTFYAEATLGSAKRMRRFAIGGGQIVRHQFRFDIAHVTLQATIGDEVIANAVPVSYKAFALNQGSSAVAHTSQRTPTFVLPRGRYRFEALVAGNALGKSLETNLEPGMAINLTIQIQAGRVLLKAGNSAHWGGSRRIEIHNQSGDIVWRGRPDHDAMAILAPGSYTLKRRGLPNQVAQIFEVQEGHTTVVEMTPKS